MAEMTKEEWKQKDLKKQASIVAQSCLERAVETCLGLGASGLDNFTLANVIRRVSETHNQYCELVWNKTLELAGEVKTNTDVVSDIEHPTPTVEQQTILTEFELLTGMNVAQAWAALGKFPTQDIIKALKIVEGKTGWTGSQVWARFSKFPTLETAEACINKILEN